jgi:hypothetical protein
MTNNDRFLVSFVAITHQSSLLLDFTYNNGGMEGIMTWCEDVDESREMRAFLTLTANRLEVLIQCFIPINLVYGRESRMQIIQETYVIFIKTFMGIYIQPNSRNA